MIAKRAYVSYIGKLQNEKRLAKYAKKKVDEMAAASTGLLARPSKATTDSKQQEDVTFMYMKAIREMFRGDSE